MMRHSSLIPASSRRPLKAEAFGLPKESLEQPDPTYSGAPAEFTDFELTKIFHGNTDRRIAITDRARDKLAEIAANEKNPDSALRIHVESGGCHGFQYNLDLTTLPEALANNEDLVVFRRSDNANATVISDESSLEILQDSKIDFTKELIGASFKVADSPFTSTSCGCGASFDFDFEKLEQAKAGKARPSDIRDVSE